MSQNDKQLDQLLKQAPDVPVSENLRHDIITSALLDVAPGVPASPALGSKILNRANSQSSATPTTNLLSKIGHQQSHTRNWAGNAISGGLMAASLILGIWAGATGNADTLIATPLELAGLQAPASNDLFEPYSIIDGFSPSENL